MSTYGAPGRELGRKRQANVAGGRLLAHKVKVTVEEEARLLELAAEHRVTVPRLLVETTLADGGETPSERRNALQALFGMRRDLAGIGTNVNQLAAWANTEQRFPREAEAVALVDQVRGAIDALNAVIREWRAS